jgi:hypothetical protein
MGCGSSSAKAAATPVEGQIVVEPIQQEKHKSPKAKAKKFQAYLAGEWKDYERQEDTILKKAYLIGHPHCKFQLRGQRYEYNFRTMKQKNLGTGKERSIRPPLGFKRPKEPLLPGGPMTVLTVKAGQAGKTVEVPDPNNKGKMIKVNVPTGAKVGQKMAVPLPEAGESASALADKQRKHGVAKKIATGTAGVAVVGAAAVGGVILGDFLTGGDMGAVDMAEDVAGAIAKGAEDGYEAVADWAPGAGEDALDWAEAAAEDAGDWLGEAADDTGDFIMSLF